MPATLVETAAPDPPATGALGRRLLTGGVLALGSAVALSPGAAGDAARQSWPPFVLVAGLLAIGAVANADGLFEAAAARLARHTRATGALVAELALVAAVTALLNLDTAVAFVTPVVVLAARRRGTDERRILYGTFFMANAASLLLPGSNLTNLLVVSADPVPGATFARHMVAPWAAAVVTTAIVVALWPHPAAGRIAAEAPDHPAPARWTTVAALALTATLLVVLAQPALPVLAVAVALVAAAVRRRALDGDAVLRAVGPAVVAGLFGLAVALGTLARTWEAPAQLLARAGTVETAAVGVIAAVALNNLPATVLLAAEPPAHPWALLVGVDLGPNLAVTGSLCALLWLTAARSVGCRPSVVQVTRMGVVVVPLSVGAALVALALTGGG